jgi:hypothetical protein
MSAARQIPVRRSIPDYSFVSRRLRGLGIMHGTRTMFTRQIKQEQGSMGGIYVIPP